MIAACTDAGLEEDPEATMYMLTCRFHLRKCSDKLSDWLICSNGGSLMFASAILIKLGS
jgi:hypothetical protein